MDLHSDHSEQEQAEEEEEGEQLKAVRALVPAAASLSFSGALCVKLCPFA